MRPFLKKDATRKGNWIIFFAVLDLKTDEIRDPCRFSGKSTRAGKGRSLTVQSPDRQTYVRRHNKDIRAKAQVILKFPF